MRRVAVIAAMLAMVANVCAHHSDGGDQLTQSFCSDYDVEGFWQVFHPNGGPVTDGLKQDAYLIIDYDADLNEFRAFLFDSDYVVAGNPTLAVKCSQSSPPNNAVLSVPVAPKSGGITEQLCVEKVRGPGQREKRKNQGLPKGSQVGIYKIAQGSACRSYHGNLPPTDPEVLAQVTPGHSHADN